LPVGSSASTIAGQRPGDRNPLPLPAGQLGRAGVRALREADHAKRAERLVPPPGQSNARVQQPVSGVVQHRGVFVQEKLLEYETDRHRT
jgi:hypothetical protein